MADGWYGPITTARENPTAVGGHEYSLGQKSSVELVLALPVVIRATSALDHP